MHHTSVGRPWLLYGLLTCSLGLNLYMVTHRPSPARPPVVASIPIQNTTSARSDAPMEGPQAVPVNVVSPTQVDRNAPVDRDRGDWELLDVEVEHSLARTLSAALDDHGPTLSALFARLFHWDIDLRKDLRKSDRIVAAWREGDEGLEIAAASLQSSKLRRSLTVYRWQRSGDAYPSYWFADGTESERHLKETPLAEYQQVTALLRDRPSHAGMDFKTPIGTPVLATRAGTVSRVNWNTRANGRCVELRFLDGTLAKYLHLDRTDVRAGQRVAVGARLGASGNTGRSTAPHLHYQLNQGRRVIDPVSFHGTAQRSIRQGDRNAFESHVARLDALLGRALARR